MKTLDAATVTRLARNDPKGTACWVIVLEDGTVKRITSHDQELVFSGQAQTTPAGLTVDGTYLPGLMDPSGALSASTDGRVGTSEIFALMDDPDLTEQDFMSGRYKNAEIFMFIAFWDDVTIPVVPIDRGRVGEASMRQGHVVLEFRDLMQLLQQPVGRSITPLCPWELGDANCGVDLGPFTVSGTVESVTDRANFTTSINSGSPTPEAGLYDFGLLTWTTGHNTGLEMEVKRQTGSGFTLFLPMPYAVQVGDGFDVYQGCDFKKQTCIDKFDNLVPDPPAKGFGGMTDLPGTDALLNTPDAE